jgi:hypothetical protein
VAGNCQFQCQGVYLKCGTTCANPQTSVDHCGGCDHACPTVPGGAPQCAAGDCRIQCNAGLALCDAACVDTSTDENHCGRCGKSCNDRECIGGKCVKI